MDSKIETLYRNLRDERSRKVIFVSHCILNENTRYLVEHLGRVVLMN